MGFSQARFGGLPTVDRAIGWRGDVFAEEAQRRPRA
jgi:hypothetical protein